jgi:putative chitinase
MITTATLVACGVGPTQARTFAVPLALACERFRINTRHRIAGFLGQYLVETDNLTALEESLYYRKPERIALVFQRLAHRGNQELVKLTRNPRALGNAAYAGVNGNGDEASGDGWRYRGRGLPHLTGRGNYAAAAAGLGRPYVESPELVALPPDACLAGAWYWSANGCNPLADTSQWDAITRVVNGPGMMKRDERRSLTDDLLQVLP